jgi:hypothetical protein
MELEDGHWRSMAGGLRGGSGSRLPLPNAGNSCTAKDSTRSPG